MSHPKPYQTRAKPPHKHQTIRYADEPQPTRSSQCRVLMKNGVPLVKDIPTLQPPPEPSDFPQRIARRTPQQDPGARWLAQHDVLSQSSGRRSRRRRTKPSPPTAVGRSQGQAGQPSRPDPRRSNELAAPEARPPE